MALTHLGSPIRLGTAEIPNRTAMAPMGVGLYSDDETWPRREIRYFEERGFPKLYLMTDDWRLPAVKTYLQLGFEPDLYDDDHEGRWAKLRDTLGI